MQRITFLSSISPIVLSVGRRRFTNREELDGHNDNIRQTIFTALQFEIKKKNIKASLTFVN